MAIPDLPDGPFTRSMARRAGVTDRMLQGRGYVRVFPRVWRRCDHAMTADDWRTAARLALPDRARLTGISRIQELGLDYGPRLPVRCVVQGPLHLAFANVFLHRTKRMPPVDAVGVTPAAAFVFYCARARVVDAIKVGDWLLHHDHMTRDELVTLANAELWRPGAHESLWVVNHLDSRSASLRESEVRAVLEFAGLPVLEVNRALPEARGRAVIGDLVHTGLRVVVEYEGQHHQEDRDQYRSDIRRYATLRRLGYRYVQVTKEDLDRPRRAVNKVYDELVDAGYEGPEPRFGEQWRALFARIATVVAASATDVRRPA
jgi:very-short-patch-repair endonuclease